ncbi:MAG: PilZ domain-containing protein [Sedimentisphaerales bacterium]|nr:PilZ domain-containing protein [Sedimentisphaerales bacterium]
MSAASDRRRERRIRFSWPLWFGYDPNGQLLQGKVADLSRSGVAFLTAHDQAPAPGSHVLTRFSYPLERDTRFAMGSYLHWAEVLRCDEAAYGQRRVAMRLHQPLPGEFAPVDRTPDKAEAPEPAAEQLCSV